MERKAENCVKFLKTIGNNGNSSGNLDNLGIHNYENKVSLDDRSKNQRINRSINETMKE